MIRSLRIICLLVCTLFASMALAESDVPAGEVHWLSYKDALVKAKAEKKLIFVDMYADWCVPCRIMDVNVYGNSSVAALLNTRFVPVKLDTDSQEIITCDGKKKTVQKCYHEVWELSALPSFVLVAPKGLSILTVTQSLTTEDMLDLLSKFLSKEKEWIAR